MRFRAGSLSLFALSLLACQSGGVVSIQGVPQDSGVTTTGGIGRARTARSEDASASEVLAFGILGDGLLDGVAFKSSGSATANAFELLWDEGIAPEARLIYALGSDSLLSLDPHGRNLVRTDLSTLAPRSELRSTEAIRSFAVASSGATAWVSASGAIRVGNTPVALPPGEAAIEVAFENDSRHLLASLHSGITIELESPQSGPWRRTFDIPGQEAAVSPSGKLIAFVSERGTLEVIDRKKSSILSSVGVPGEAHEPTWQSDSRLAYWVDLGGDEAELRIVDLTAQKEKRIPIGLSGSERRHVICPAWLGNAVYFASSSDARGYRIYRLDAAVAGEPTLFASPREDARQYVCPVAGTGGTP